MIVKFKEGITLFCHHLRYKANNITHLCFTYDLILFCRAYLISVIRLKEVWSTFHKWSDLKANQEKSNIYIVGVIAEGKNLIKNALNFERVLSFKYLGVPLKSNKLIVHVNLSWIVYLAEFFPRKVNFFHIQVNLFS